MFSKKLSRLMAAVLIAVILAGLMPVIALADDDTPIVFADPNLEAAIKGQMGKGQSDSITQGEALEVTRLSLYRQEISNLEGLQYFTNLDYLDLGQNKIVDISPLAELASLQALFLNSNQIIDISALAGLAKLQNIWLNYNQISNILPLAGLTKLKNLELGHNQISDISALTELTDLRDIGLTGNQISDISVLAGLTKLQSLSLINNEITDISALAELSDLEYLWINDNFLDISTGSDARNVIDKLRKQECHVIYQCQKHIGIYFSTPSILMENSAIQTLDVYFYKFTKDEIASVSAKSNNDGLEIGSVSFLDGINITAKKTGKATITLTATLKNGNIYTAECHVIIVNDMDDPVPFPQDSKLETAIKDYIRMWGYSGDITYSQAADIPMLWLDYDGIDDLTGLEYFVGLTRLDLSDNKISDITPIGNLSGLQELDLSRNKINDISPLRNIHFQRLSLQYNDITDITPLMGIKSYEVMDLRYNRLDLDDEATMSVIEYLWNLPGTGMEYYSQKGVYIRFYQDEREIVKFGDSPGINLDIDNNTPELYYENATFIIAKYDSNGNLLGNLEIFDRRQLGYGWSCYIDFKGAAVDKVKVMVWNDPDEMIPYGCNEIYKGEGVVYKWNSEQ